VLSESPLEATEYGLVPTGKGWFVLNAGVEQETTDAKQAYARLGTSERTRYRDGWLPG
jgi:hypothetical protein